MEAIKLWPAPEKAEINLIFLSSQGPRLDLPPSGAHGHPELLWDSQEQHDPFTLFPMN